MSLNKHYLQTKHSEKTQSSKLRLKRLEMKRATSEISYNNILEQDLCAFINNIAIIIIFL